MNPSNEDGLELYAAMMGGISEIKESVSEYASYGLKLAAAERDYRRERAKKMTELKSQGMPVTMIRDIVLGDDRISQMRFERDKYQALYKAQIELINAQKLGIRVMKDNYAMGVN